ncbi:SusD/RagB family nutrient-binding outer membrane lipoprotein [Adhaeribacter radiodurans]|uniref:SusD/RagB family nutrient-binding outer membrane lipoprotein n=1 Tax=Adhaeribacter radiodurans TaxID=2745197 RepID=A0A7L7LB71_9BACT|nr:SusD/RagB family nutrient-binding outer membrane lipoprotein [Adhaeribacter radiodurans]QMU30088.1 SusD/RagB family nutrient-binding outer membrane lipoprotein [Adhaeribacter radiodurans]
MKKILIFCIPALMFATSCKDLDEYDNLNPKAATTVPGVSLVSNAQRVLANTVNTPDYNINPFRFYVQHWAATTYPDESQFIIETRSVNRYFWDPLYRDVLSDLNEGKKVITADAVLDPKVKANQLAAVEVLEVYAWSVLVNTFGDVPYTEALNADNVLPKFDDDAAIYADLVTRLDKAIGMFDASAAGLGTGDLYYNGNVANWIKFANSLKLRLGMNYADVDPGKSKTMVEAAAPNVFTSNTDNAKITYLAALPNRNQLYESLVQSGRADFVGTTTLVDPMIATNDPRLPIYFKPVAGSTNFKGGTAGAPNSATNNSIPGAALENPTLPGMLLTYSEVEFLLAEAIERGYAVSGTASEHYNAGVTASILEWGGTATEATAYLAQPSVAYATAAGDWKQKIGFQKWISLYSQPTQAWTEWKRLDAPNLVKPAAAISEIPLRLPYPTTEANLNTTNYKAASAAIGGDVVTSRIFWDKL